MNLVDLLRQRADEHPDRPALIDQNGPTGRDTLRQSRSVSFGDLWSRVGKGAAFLRQSGLKPGDTILVFQPVSIELYELLLSAFHAGMRVMLADPANGTAFLKQCCARVRPDAFFGPWKAQAFRWFVPALRRIPLAIHSGGGFPGTRSWQAGENEAPMEPTHPDTPALITFTSGSTGTPKAAVRTHGFLLAQHRALADSMDFQPGEVDLITLPVFVLANLASGLTSVLADTDLRKPGQANASAIRRQCAAHGVTRCAASPAFFEALLKHPEGMPGFAKVFTGGAPVFPDLLRRLSHALPEAEVVAIFGSTEAEPMAHLPSGDYSAARLEQTASGHGLCTGHPVPEIELRVIRDQSGKSLLHLSPGDFQATVLPAGQVGEIVVSGDHVLPGYLDGQGDEETKIHSGDRIWHRTGDAGWIDEDGVVWLLGRSSAKLPPPPHPIPGPPDGALDYPFAIECALRASHSAYRTAALGWNDRRTLVIGGHPPAAEFSAMDTLARSLGIESVIAVDALPTDKRHNAKIDYPALRELLRKIG